MKNLRFGINAVGTLAPRLNMNLELCAWAHLQSCCTARSGGTRRSFSTAILSVSALSDCRACLSGGTLAPGWTVRVRTRSVLLHGKERQQKDAFYNSPAGETYNSRKKVAVTMGLMSADDNT